MFEALFSWTVVFSVLTLLVWCVEASRVVKHFTSVVSEDLLERFWDHEQEAQLPQIACDAWNCHSRSLKVIHCCANRRGIYDCLLTLNSKLTSVFNRSWDFTPSLHVCTLPLFQVELLKHGWEYLDMLWWQGAQNTGLSNHKLKFMLKCATWSQCTPIPDRQTNEHHSSSTRFVLTNASRARNGNPGKH